MAEDKLGFVCIDVRYGMPQSLREEDPAGNDGVDMVGLNFREDENVWMTATIPGRASSGSSEAAAIIPRTVS